METIFSVFAILFGILCLYLAIRDILKLIRSKDFISCEASVVDIKQTSNISNGKRYTNYTPIVSYSVEGVSYVERYDQSSTSCKYEIGDTIDIAYNPNKPSDFIIDKDYSIITDMIFMIGIAALLFFVAYKLLF